MDDILRPPPTEELLDEVRFHCPECYEEVETVILASFIPATELYEHDHHYYYVKCPMCYYEHEVYLTEPIRISYPQYRSPWCDTLVNKDFVYRNYYIKYPLNRTVICKTLLSKRIEHHEAMIEQERLHNDEMIEKLHQETKKRKRSDDK